MPEYEKAIISEDLYFTKLIDLINQYQELEDKFRLYGDAEEISDRMVNHVNKGIMPSKTSLESIIDNKRECYLTLMRIQQKAAQIKLFTGLYRELFPESPLWRMDNMTKRITYIDERVTKCEQAIVEQTLTREKIVQQKLKTK